MVLFHYSSKLLFSLLILIQLLQIHGQTNQTCDSKVDTITSAEIRKDAPGVALKKVTKNGSPVEYTVAEFDHLDQSIKTFLGTFKHVLFIAVALGPHGALAGAASNYVATFSNIILDTYIRQRASGRKKTMWEQIKANVDNAIGKAMTTSHFDNIKTEFQKFPVIFRLGEKFGAKELMEIVNLKHEVFPQDESTVQYSPYWAPTILTWMANMIAGYLEYRTYNPKGSCMSTPENECLPHCGLAEELVVVRHEIIQAIQAMYKKRYQSISGIFHTMSGGANGDNSNRLSLQFRDDTTSEKFPSAIYKSTKNGRTVKQDILDPLIKKTHDVVSKFYDGYNEFVKRFKKTKIFCGCPNIPQEIPKFFTDKYNPYFYGSGNYDESTCQLPCAKYGETYYWCPNENYDNSASSSYSKIYDKGDNWGECTPPDFEKVIPTMGTLNSWLDYKELPAGVTETGLKFYQNNARGVSRTSNEITFGRNSGIQKSYSSYSWEDELNCDADAYLDGFSIRADFEDDDDNAGISGIHGYCSNGGELTSDETSDGDWVEVRKTCIGGYTGARVDSNDAYDSEAGDYSDGLGVVNLVMKCKENLEFTPVEQTISAPGQERVLTSRNIMRGRIVECGTDQVICGFRVKVQDPTVGDEAGIVQIKFKCCYFVRDLRL